MIYIPKIDVHHYESKQSKLNTLNRNHVEVIPSMKTSDYRNNRVIHPVSMLPLRNSRISDFKNICICEIINGYKANVKCNILPTITICLRYCLKLVLWTKSIKAEGNPSDLSFRKK
jgi:hypothetical protein